MKKRLLLLQQPILVRQLINHLEHTRLQEQHTLHLGLILHLLNQLELIQPNLEHIQVTLRRLPSHKLYPDNSKATSNKGRASSQLHNNRLIQPWRGRPTISSWLSSLVFVATHVALVLWLCISPTNLNKMLMQTTWCQPKKGVKRRESWPLRRLSLGPFAPSSSSS